MFQFHYFLLVFAFFEQALGIYLQACSDDLNCNFNTTALRCSKIDQKCTCIRYHYWDPMKNMCILNYYSLKKSLSHSESKDEELFIKGKESIETKRYHHNCTHDDHCQDFSLICSSEINKCVCAKFHDLIYNKCVLNYTELNHWLASLENEKDVKAELDRKAVGVFHQLAFSGILAIGLGILGAFFYVFIFCLMKHNVPYIEPVDEPESQKSKDNGNKSGLVISEFHAKKKRQIGMIKNVQTTSEILFSDEITKNSLGMVEKYDFSQIAEKSKIQEKETI